MKKNWFTFVAEGTKEQAEEKILVGVTLQSRPTIMDNKLEERGVLFGNAENGLFWLMKTSEKNSFLPQRIFTGQIITKDEKTVIGGRFAFVGGFHLMWFVCMVLGAITMLLFFHMPVLMGIAAALFAVCWIVAAVCGPLAYRAEEKQVLDYLEGMFSILEEELAEK